MKLNVNGKDAEVDVPGDTPLLWVLRDNLGLMGTKYGCGVAQCGACTVHVANVAVRACVTPASAAENKTIVTIEAMADDTIGKAVQDAWVKLSVVQCGYCQSGQVMSAVALITSLRKPTDDDIDEAMSDNICRCGTYPRIRAAVHMASKTVFGE